MHLVRHRRRLPGLMTMLAFASCAHHTHETQMTQMTGASEHVRPGITVLIEDSLALIRGKRIALITNQTGVDANGVSDIELLRGTRAQSAGITLVRLFSPEHGIRGTEDREHIERGIDER